jgi:Transposase
MQIYTGLDLSRSRLDWHALGVDGTLVDAGAVPPDGDGLARLVRRLGDASVLAVVEVMNGARFVHDQLELRGWDVRLADPHRSRALAPLACKTDRIDCWVLAELARRDLIPEVWLPDPAVRGERERARFRLHLVKHRTMLKNRIHQTLIAHGQARPTANLFTQKGRDLLDGADRPLPRPTRPPTRLRDRRRHDRPQTHRSDLVDAHPQPAPLRQAPRVLDRPTVPKRIALPEHAPIQPDRHRRRDRGMSHAHQPQPRARDPATRAG